MNHDISCNGSHDWKWLLVIGTLFIILGIHSAGRLRNDLDDDYELNNYATFWALCLTLLGIIVYVGVVGLQDHVEEKLTIVILIQLALGVAWAYFIWKTNKKALLFIQLLLLASVAYLMYIFSTISTFAFIICIVYFVTIIYACYFIAKSLNGAQDVEMS